MRNPYSTAAADNNPTVGCRILDITLMQAADEGTLQNGDNTGPTLLGAEAALRVVAEQLPKIVPNMLINKRDGERRWLHACCLARVPFETVKSHQVMWHMCAENAYSPLKL